MPPRSENKTDLTFRSRQMPFVDCLRVNRHRPTRPIHFLMEREWNQCPVIARLTKHRSLLYSDAYNFKGAIVDDKGLSKRINKRKQILDNVRADDAHIPRVFDVVRCHQPAGAQLSTEYACKIGRVALDLRIHVIAAEFHATPHVDRGTHSFAVEARRLYSVHVRDVEVLPLLVLGPFIE